MVELGRVGYVIDDATEAKSLKDFNIPPSANVATGATMWLQEP